jgi:hypothetical protein
LLSLRPLRVGVKFPQLLDNLTLEPTKKNSRLAGDPRRGRLESFRGTNVSSKVLETAGHESTKAARATGAMVDGSGNVQCVAAGLAPYRAIER